MEKINIVVTGHTNTGKTTLSRTLMKSEIGEIGDRANVTKKSNSYYYNGLQANFIDTPGFRFASNYSMYLEIIEMNPNYKLSDEWRKKIELDLEAVNAIKDSNVALYVCDLMIVPDESHDEEMMVIKKIQPQIVGILNKVHTYSMVDRNDKNVEDRIELWKQSFFKNGIDKYVVFDAHWDCYSKVSLIYDYINSVISMRERQLFEIGLKLFKKREDEIREDACKLLSACIVKLQSLKKEYKRGSYDEKKTKIEIEKIKSEYVLEFMNKVTELYKIASEYPTDSHEAIRLKLNSQISWKDRIGSGAGATTIMSGVGAVIGLTIGAFITGILSGGLGSGAGAVFGKMGRRCFIV